MTAVQDRVAQFLEGRRRNRREIVTPEGVPLPVEIASFGERVCAFALDLLICFGAIITVLLLAVLLLGPLAKLHGVGLAAVGVLLLVAFVFRNFYFMHFELAWRGATPGKRLLGLRVIDRGGGALLPAAVVARNLTREIEAFLPLSLLLSIGGIGPTPWMRLALGVWLLLFGMLPLFNRDRLRAGDLIGGTLVVAVHRRVLLGDLVDAAAGYRFTDRQLRAYGAFELQILEELLRRPDSVDTRRLKREVCDKVVRRIAWPAAISDAAVESFLRDFYTAERAWLEREQLLGKLHADKNAAGG